MGIAEENKIRHVAIIMDGNGRWAKQRGLDHIEGHKEGSEAVKRTLEAAKEFGLEYLTLYAFSTENWKRSEKEVTALMELLSSFIDEYIEEVMKHEIRIRAIGRLYQLPEKTRKKLEWAIEQTAENFGGTVVLALSYGGRAEIVDAVKNIAHDAIDGKILPDKIDEKSFQQYLYAPDIPDPDLMIRTSGECRISNFLLWELSYSEIYISEVMWPDFNKEEFKKAIEDYSRRDRRFGKRK